MLNPTAWNWSNYAGFFWGGGRFLCVIYAYFRVPKPRDRFFAELGLLFERGVSARRFATTKVDVFEETVEGSVIEHYEDKLHYNVHHYEHEGEKDETLA